MKKILIVDDQKTILLTLEAILKQQGYQVFAATNSIDAFDKFNEFIDLIITDAIMPLGANGYSLISTIRAAEKNSQVADHYADGKTRKS